jgi:hypothetical protein
MWISSEELFCPAPVIAFCLNDHPFQVFGTAWCGDYIKSSHPHGFQEFVPLA